MCETDQYRKLTALSGNLRKFEVLFSKRVTFLEFEVVRFERSQEARWDTVIMRSGKAERNHFRVEEDVSRCTRSIRY